MTSAGTDPRRGRSRTIVLTYCGPLDEPGGGVTGLVEIARAFGRRGIHVIVVPSRPGDGAFHDVSDLDVRTGPGSRVSYLFEGRGVARIVRGLIREHHPIGVIGWAHELAFVQRRGRRMPRVPLAAIAAGNYRLWRDRETATWGPLRRASDELFRWRSLRRVDVVFALSEHTRAELVEVARVEPSMIVVAPWGVDERFFDVPRAIPGAPIRRLLFFGAVNEVKGVYDLIEALTILDRSELQLRVAGWGDVDRARRAATAAGVSEQLEFVGRRDHEQLRADLAWAQVAVLPSRTESFGLAIAEAQASGLAVISTCAGSIPEVVDDGVTGWLVPAGDPPALAAAMEQALADPEETARRGVAGRERVRRLFTWERTAETILNGLAQASGHP